MKKAVKTKKIIRKTFKKRKKADFSDAIKAFMLVGVIVAFSALVSFIVIMAHSSMNEEVITEIINDEAVSIAVEEPPLEPVTPARETTIAPPPPVSASPSREQGRPARNTEAPVPAPIPPSATVTPSAPEQTADLGTVVFVIDDAGNNLRELEPFLRVPGPLTIAVLPGLPHSAEAARRIRAAGKEVILHQPMEAIGAQNPGPGAIYTGMSAQEIRSILARNIAEVGPVSGINNHQGSKVTMDREIMQTILDFCAENNLYFLDSRTTADSVVPALARQIGLPFAERNVFIDNEQNKDAMLRYINTGLLRAQRNGIAVMIGHTWSPDLAPLLTEQFPVWISQGYTIKTALEIIK